MIMRAPRKSAAPNFQLGIRHSPGKGDAMADPTHNNIKRAWVGGFDCTLCGEHRTTKQALAKHPCNPQQQSTHAATVAGAAGAAGAAAAAADEDADTVGGFSEADGMDFAVYGDGASGDDEKQDFDHPDVSRDEVEAGGMEVDDDGHPASEEDEKQEGGDDDSEVDERITEVWYDSDDSEDCSDGACGSDIGENGGGNNTESSNDIGEPSDGDKGSRADDPGYGPDLMDLQDEEPEAPPLDSLDEGIMNAEGFRLKDGGEENLRCTEEGLRSPWCPFENLTVSLLTEIVRRMSLSRKHTRFLFRCLKYRDKDGNGIKPEDVPSDPDHFHARMRLRTPLARVWEHPTRKAVSMAPNELLQRLLESPGAFEEMTQNQQGKVLSEAEEEANQIRDRHVTPIATLPHAGLREGILHGELAASSSLFGLQTIVLRRDDDFEQGEEEEEVAVGDMILAKISTGRAGRPKLPGPCRLAKLQWQYSSPDAANTGGRLMAQVNRLLSAKEAKLSGRHSNGASEADVWEVSNHGTYIDVSNILRRISVAPHGQGPSIDSGGDVKMYCGKGFIERATNGTYRVLPQVGKSSRTPMQWRQGGAEGQFFNRWALGVFSNTTDLDVVTLPFQIFSDSFNYTNLGGSPFPVNASYFTLGNISVQRRRLPKWWQLFTMGMKGSEWQEELDPGLAILGKMQDGCVARIRRGQETLKASGSVLASIPVLE